MPNRSAPVWGALKLFLSGRIFFVVDGEAVRSCPAQRVLGEEKDSRWRALGRLLLMGPHAGLVSELGRVFHFCQLEACKRICACYHDKEWFMAGGDPQGLRSICRGYPLKPDQVPSFL